jgi:hypothetical protein
MGFDLYVVTRKQINDSSANISDQHWHHWGVVTRGFCILIMSARYSGTHVITELGKALGLDLSFLLEPQFFDPQVYKNSDKLTVWVALAPFLEKLREIQYATTTISAYESTMEYDRIEWTNYFGTGNYFGAGFRKDIQSLIDFLEQAKMQEQHEFSFETSH